MAKINKLKKDVAGVSTTIYPVTIPQAVVDPISGKTARTELDEKADHGYTSSPKTLKQVEDNTKLSVQKNTEQIDNLTNVLGNIGDDKISAVGYQTVSFPKNSTGHADIKLEGLTAENLIVNGDFRNGLMGWNNFDNRLDITVNVGSITASSTVDNSRIQKDLTGKTKIGSKWYYYANVKASSSLVDLRDAIYTSLAGAQHSGNGLFQRLSIIHTPSNNNIFPSIWIGNGQTAEIEYISAIDLTTLFGFGNEPGLATCDAMFSSYFEGKKSFLPTGRLRSIGKNIVSYDLCKKQKSSYVQVVVKDGRECLSWQNLTNGSNVSLFKGTFKPNQVYTISGYFAKTAGTTFLFRIVYTDDTYTSFNAGVVGSALDFAYLTFTSQAGKTIDRLSGSWQNGTYTFIDINTLQINEGSTAIPYEPYQESKLYINAPELRSNGLVKDEIRKGANGYELVKRIGSGTVGSELITNAADREFTSDTGWWGKDTNWSIDTVNGVAKSDGSVLGYLRAGLNVTIGSWYIVSFNVKALSGGVIVTSGWTTNSNLTITTTGFKKVLIKASTVLMNFNTSASSTVSIDDISIRLLTLNEINAIAGICTEFSDSAILYTLEAPTITPIQSSGLLTAEGNGTVYQEQALADAGIYTDKMSILKKDFPISTLEEIKVIGNDGSETYLDVSAAVISSDKLSFTHPNLAIGNLVFFTYFFDQEKVNGKLTVNSYNNANVKLDTTNGKYYKVEYTVTNGVPTLKATEV